ncbi:unnamed protein product [Meloidogyne enterolobii]|uniref:Uncharacterized protein n=1 Tax=Meloidogyne enterolobii TaxID=390850 RepID=A0ACB0Y5G8_MELEN
MPFAIRRHRDWLFSVGDDRALRVWTMDGLKIGEIYGHGARPFVLELFEREKMAFTGGVDEYLNIWRWTGFINFFRNSLGPLYKTHKFLILSANFCGHPQNLSANIFMGCHCQMATM